MAQQERLTVGIRQSIELLAQDTKDNALGLVLGVVEAIRSRCLVTQEDDVAQLC